jgi:hypothetical protein
MAGNPTIVGELPESVVRRGPRHGGSRTGLIDLPLPERKRLIEL